MKYLKKAAFYILLVLLALVFICPLMYALYNSLLPLDKVNTLVPPSEFTLDNYVELFVNRPIFTWFINTLVVAGVTLLSQLTTALLAGYALAKLRFPGRGIAFNCVLVTLMIPFQVLLTPLYIMVAKLGWHDRLIGLIIPFMLNSLYVFMARQFFVTLPDDLIEAARIDGLGHGRIFFSIGLPLSKPVITTITGEVYAGRRAQYIKGHIFQPFESDHGGGCGDLTSRADPVSRSAEAVYSGDRFRRN